MNLFLSIEKTNDHNGMNVLESYKKATTPTTMNSAGCPLDKKYLFIELLYTNETTWNADKQRIFLGSVHKKWGEKS